MAETEIFKFKCDHCNQRIETSEDRVGQEVSCPSCREKIVVPELPVVQLTGGKDPEFDFESTETSEIRTSGAPPELQLSKADDTGEHFGKEEDGEASLPSPISGRYKVIPLSLSSDDAGSAIAVARKVEEIINAFTGDGWRFVQVETIPFETKGKLGAREELAHMVILERE